jgi:hypothetical protein
MVTNSLDRFQCGLYVLTIVLEIVIYNFHKNFFLDYLKNIRDNSSSEWFANNNFLKTFVKKSYEKIILKKIPECTPRSYLQTLD